MKHETELRRQMYKDLMAAYRKVCDRYECTTQMEAYEKTVMSPAPRYYVDARWALQRIAPLMRGDMESLNNLLPLRKEMYTNLFQETLRLSRKLEYQGKSLSYILKFAILSPAPRFYIGVEKMKNIFLYKSRNK